MFNNKKNNVVLIDSNAFVHKAFHGYEPQYTKEKEDLRILHGLIQALYDSIKNIDKIEYLYFVFDSDTSSLYRKSIFPAYKENRPPTDPELTRQRIRTKEIIKKEFGFPLIEYPGFEADDVIGTMAKIYETTHNVVIVSPDKDLFQLINNSIMVLRPKKENNKKCFEYISEIGVEKYFGVKPTQIPDYLSLVGDSADNLPGIYGLGKQGAANILNLYNSVEHIYCAIDELIEKNDSYNKYYQNIKENYDLLEKVKMLATIKIDLDLKKEIEESLTNAQEIQNNINYRNKVYNLIEYYNIKPYLLTFLLE